MPLSAEDAALVADMRQRELHLKERQRAADAIQFIERRFRVVFAVLAGVVCAAAGTGLALVADEIKPNARNLSRPVTVQIVACFIIGVFLGLHVLRSAWGRRVRARRVGRELKKYTSELHAGRRWQPFYYGDEDIAAYVPQILYFIEGEQRFESVAAALAFAKEHRHDTAVFAGRAMELFTEVVEVSNVVVVSNAEESGRPASRIMHFVRSDRPHVWYVATAPEGNKVHALDRGMISVLTGSMELGWTISSNRVQIRRAELGFPEVADLYRAQVPGYVDQLTDEEQQREVVYELTLLSAKVDTWLEHEVVVFDAGARSEFD
ncbi:hypothetical protein GCM10009795_017190 [Nocardioides hankookensis]|uniref:Pyridoxamine 5'-phosphate oxidase putative domain-containing protein n=1 Tax=Nocardioides hankookensis TaxID=443157 RepID=A0ABW1LLC0_9ACTN